jgi:hypothetical protein
MDDGTLTLKEFFAARSKFGPTEIKSRLEKSDRIASLHEKISSTVGKPGWPMAIEEIYRKTADLLNISVLDLLVGGWNTYQGLKKYRDREKYAPTQSILVPLAEHTVKSEHHPHLEISINEEPAGTVDFEIRLTFIARGVILLIQDGRIKGAKTGEIKGKGSLTCEGTLLLEQDFRPIQLPGSVDLGEGVQIPA